LVCGRRGGGPFLRLTRLRVPLLLTACASAAPSPANCLATTTCWSWRGRVPARWFWIHGFGAREPTASSHHHHQQQQQQQQQQQCRNAAATAATSAEQQPSLSGALLVHLVHLSCVLLGVLSYQWYHTAPAATLPLPRSTASAPTPSRSTWPRLESEWSPLPTVVLVCAIALVLLVCWVVLCVRLAVAVASAHCSSARTFARRYDVMARACYEKAADSSAGDHPVTDGSCDIPALPAAAASPVGPVP
jgi:hypothetical protein